MSRGSPAQPSGGIPSTRTYEKCVRDQRHEPNESTRSHASHQTGLRRHAASDRERRQLNHHRHRTAQPNRRGVAGAAERRATATGRPPPPPQERPPYSAQGPGSRLPLLPPASVLRSNPVRVPTLCRGDFSVHRVKATACTRENADDEKPRAMCQAGDRATCRPQRRPADREGELDADTGELRPAQARHRAL